MKLNLGCSDAHRPGYVNVDISAPADEIVDLNNVWPWEDNSVDEIIAHDIIEHLRLKIYTMNQLWRVLKPGGVVSIKVPTTDGPGAFQDPTHVSFWHRNSFWYYTDGDAHHTRFSKAYGIDARFKVVSEQVTYWQSIPTLEIHLQAIKPGVPTANLDMDSGIVEKLQGCRVIGAMRIKNESQWIRQSIESQLGICDKMLVFDDHSTDDTREIVRSFGERCVLIESPFEGVDEGRDKNYLLQHLVAADPEWVLMIDGDEVLERRAGEIVQRELLASNVVSYRMRVAYFWDSESKVRVDGVYADFSRPSLFRVRGQSGLYFPTGAGGNFHCGSCPEGLRGGEGGIVSDARIKHYGYLTWDERQRKYEFYNRIDPNNQAEDCYRHIVEIPGARHAPGPTVLAKWFE